MSRLSELSIRRNSNNQIQVGNSNQVQRQQNNATLPSMLGQNMQLMSGVRKGNNYYITVHGKSFNEIVKSFKIPIDIMESFYNENNEEDVNAVIAFALESLILQMRGGV